MLDSDGQRKPERLEHLVEQVLYLLRGLRGYRCSNLIVLRAGWDVCYGTALRKACGRVYHGIMVLRINQHLRAGGVLEALGSQLPHRTGRDALDEFSRE